MKSPLFMQFELGIPLSEPVGALRIGQAQLLAPETWRVGDAVCYPIGWFDYSDQDAPLSSPFGDETLDEALMPPKPPSILRTLAVILQAPLCSLTGVDNVLEWSAPLLPFQRMGVATLLERRALLLADEMGLGKTIQAIAAMRILFHRKEINSVLVVVPTGLIVQWRKELARWAPELSVLAIRGATSERGRLWRLPAQVKLIGYETLRSDVLEQDDSQALKQSWGLVVLDEASRIKNPSSGISIACARLPGERRWALTGTPVENSAGDADSILNFLLRPAKDRATRDDLSTRFQAHVLRRRRADVLPQLPAKRIREIAIELGPA
jgi:hypothetical protein